MNELIRRGERYLIVRPIFSLTRAYRVFGPDGSLAMYVEQPWLQLRQELIIYADEAQLLPLLVIRNRRVAGFNMEHDISDALTSARLGSVRTRSLSFFRNRWDILGPGEERALPATGGGQRPQHPIDKPAGLMEETGNALLRRAFRFLPGQHRIELGGRTVATLQQRFHLFKREFELDILQVDDPIPAPLAIACALIAILADLRREQRA